MPLLTLASIKSVHIQRGNRNCRENLLILLPHFPLFVTISNHDGVITHLEPDILECEVKRALGNITTNKASEGHGIPGELFQILKDDAMKVLHSICQ